MPLNDSELEERASLAVILDRNVEVVTRTLRGEPGAAKPLSALLSARTTADAIEQTTQRLVAQARADGHTWQAIGELLAISRQAAQQRFGQGSVPPADADAGPLALRAAEIVSQLDAGNWDDLTADWSDAMRNELSPDRLAEVWTQLRAGAGTLEALGQPTVVRKGPFRIADVPLAFTHGPMKARVVFSHDQQVSGLFVLLPDAP